VSPEPAEDTAVSLVGISLLSLMLFTALFTTPLCLAVLAGVRSARRPEHRVTPESPWVFFDRMMRLHLRRWRGIWALLFIGIALAYTAWGRETHAWRIRLALEIPLWINISLIPALGFVGLGLFTYSAVTLWAPHCRSL
jgi:hypothetical protein